MKDRIYGVGFRRLKTWTRAGLIQETKEMLVQLKVGSSVLSIGGYGSTDNALENICLKNGLQLVKLDIDEEHLPDLVADLSHTDFRLAKQFDAVVALEVLEHIPDYETAILNMYSLLKPGGMMVLSTPWIIPIHDKPDDYHRFTHFELRRILSEFPTIRIGHRGNYIDSCVVLFLRGLISGGKAGKALFALGYVWSYLLKPPKIKFPKLADFPDSTIGYLVHARK